MLKTRRALLRTVGLSAVAAGAAAVIPGEAAGASSPAGTTLIAHVTDAKAGTIEVMMGDREVVITDQALTAKLLRAVH